MLPQTGHTGNLTVVHIYYLSLKEIYKAIDKIITLVFASKTSNEQRLGINYIGYLHIWVIRQKV